MDAVPFELASPQFPLIVLEARLNGGAPVKALLDTGNATPFVALVSPRAAEAAGAKALEGPAYAGRGASAAVPIKRAELASMQVGPVRLGPQEIGVTPALEAVSAKAGRAVDVNLGYGFLERRVVSIDYARKLADFDARRGSARSAVPFTLGPKRPLILVQVKMNGSGPYTFALDTGASHTVLAPATVEKAGLKSAGEITVEGAGGGRTAKLVEVSGLQVGSLPPASFRAVTADIFGPLSEATGARLDGVLGADVFGRGKLTIDYPGGKLWIE